jgi:CDP-glycerol glycerophosphotransferase (TagB/SpsB family)
LNKVLKENNIIFYFTLHHMIEKYKILFKMNQFISYINQDKILECLIKTNLIITDFSSIIFDIIVRKKPYIIFIPDSDDPNLHNIYIDHY